MHLFPDSRARPLSVGLDIGSRMVKFMGMDQSGGRPEIDIAGAFELPVDTVSQGVVVNRRAFAKTLRRELHEVLTRPGQVAFSIPSNEATLRWMTLPRLGPEELREAAKFKVKRHLPYPVSEAYLEVSQPEDEEDDDDGGVTSLVVAVRQNVVDSRAEAILGAGMEPVRAELEAQALLRIVERRLSLRSVLWRDASLTIIDVGGTNTHMYVVQNQRLQFIRGVRFGSEMFSQAVSQTLDCSMASASELLNLPGSSLDPNGIARINNEEVIAVVDLSKELEKLTREFLRLLRYFRSLHPERSYAGILDHVIICGGLVGMNGFAEYLEQNLGLRVERARPIAGILAHFDRETFGSISNRQEAFTIATGLALSGIKGYKGVGKQNVDREFAWTRGA